MRKTGIILAGGENSRIGTEKTFIELRPGLSIIEHTLGLFKNIFSEIIIVTNNPQPYLKFGTRVVEDLIKNKGPLAGIFTGVCFSTNELNFVVAGDMPFIDVELMNFIMQKPEEYDLVIPEVDGKVESLFARYSKNSLPVIFSHLQRDKLKVQDILTELKVLRISQEEIERFDPEHFSFFNINTERDLKKAKELLSKKNETSKN